MLLPILFATVAQAGFIILSSDFPAISASGSNSISNSSTTQTSSSSPTSSTTPSTRVSSDSDIAASSSAASSTSPGSQITPAPSTPIASITDIPGCWTTPGHFCGRSEMPWYSYTWPMYSNPYDVSQVDDIFNQAANVTTSLHYNVTICSASWTSSLEQWLLTAPLVTTTSSPSVLVGTPYTSTTSTFHWSTIDTTPIEEDTYTFVQSTISQTFYPITDIWTTSTETFSGTTVPYTAFYASNFSYSTAGMCCSSCIINAAGNITVMHWPTQTASSSPGATPAVSLLVDTKNNFTFTWPSIYVAFTSVWATNLCSQLGNTILTTTLGFSQGELSTYVYRSSSGMTYTGFDQSHFLSSLDIAYTEAISWDIRSDCPLSTVTWYGADNIWGLFPGAHTEFSNAADASAYISTVVQYSLTITTNSFGIQQIITGDSFTGFNTDIDYVGSRVYSYYPCSPYLQLPSKLYYLSAGWNDCIPKQGFQALIDPPYTLTAGADLVAATTPALADTLPTTTSAAPASSATTPIASQTSKSAIQVPTTTSAAQVVQSSTDPGSTQAVAADPTTSTQAAIQPTTSTSPSLVLISVSSTTTSQPITLTLASTTLVVSSSAIVVGSQTLTAGGTISASGAGYSLASNGNTLVVANPTTTYTQILSTSSSVVPISTYLVSVDPTSTATLAAGGSAVTAGGTTLSLGTNGASLVINGQTSTISAFVATTTTVPEVILANSQTLIAGGAAVTVSGTVLSLQTNGVSVVAVPVTGGVSTTVAASAVGGKLTSGVVTVMPSVSIGLAGVIASMGGFGAGSSSSSSKVGGSASGTGRAAFNGTVFLGVGGRATVVGEAWVYVWGVWAGLVGLGMVVL